MSKNRDRLASRGMAPVSITGRRTAGAWRKRHSRSYRVLEQSLSSANTKGGKQYAAAHMDAILKSGPVKTLSEEEIAALEEQYKI
jgi:hypothetical protein